MSWPFKEDAAAEPARITGIGAILALVAVALIANEVEGLGRLLLVVSGPILFVGLIAWGVQIGLAAHAAEQRGSASN